MRRIEARNGNASEPSPTARAAPAPGQRLNDASALDSRDPEMLENSSELS